VSFLNTTLTVFQRITIVVAIAITFLLGLTGTVYLSLRSPEVTVPDVLGKDRFEAEKILAAASLNFRVRATRPSNEVKADTVLFQLPRSGEVVKAGQTVAMDISRATKEGESPDVVTPPEEKKAENSNANSSSNDNKNDNKPARNRNSNKNSNENDNGNRNANSNRAKANSNANANSTTGSTNANRAAGNANRAAAEGKPGATGNQNENSNRRSAPKPSPTEHNNQE
jgi:beta-lactam-binding protein with PASTA domain